MKTIKVDLAVIGGGPAGMAAAIQGKKEGLKKVLIIEREYALGGILRQCVHDGFGIEKFGERLTGGQYAQHYINEVIDNNIDFKLNTMTLEITLDKTIYAVNEEEGMLKIETKSIVLAMGCRERTRSQVFIFGARPAGVLTAGSVQRFINIEGYLPGKKAVILGSGDIGLIMARRMTLEKIEVEGVYEIMPTEGGLTRNIEQCLKDYNIPLHLSTTITKIHGKDRVEGVTVAKVDKELNPIEDTKRYIDCDLVVLSVGLIPENELSKKIGIEIDPRTNGPIVDESMMTSIDGIFAAGNVVSVFDLVDYVSLTGEIAGKGAAQYALKNNKEKSYINIEAGENIAFALPQKIDKNKIDGNINVFMRVKKTEENIGVFINNNGEEKLISKKIIAKPPEMVVTKINEKLVKEADNILTINIRKE